MSSDLMQAMGLDLMEQAKTHLEFFGYAIAPMERAPHMLEARHQGKYPFSFYASSYVLRFFAYFATNEGDELGLLRFINSLNQDSSVICFTKSKVGTLVCEAAYHGVYTKMDFGLFFETWDHELHTPLRERRAEFKKYVG